MSEGAGLSILSAPVVVFDFRAKSVRAADGEVIGGIRSEDHEIVCRDPDDAIVWIVENAGPFQVKTRILDADRQEIGTLAINRLATGGEPFATLVQLRRSELEIRDDGGEVLARLHNESRFWSFHQRVRIEVEPFVHAAERLVVLATVCVFEASATLD
jgi:hypothetical protein